MKKKVTYLLMFSLIALFAGCKKSDVSTSYAMDADINGGHFSAQGSAYVTAVVTPNNSGGSGTQLLITGISGTKKIILTVANYTNSQVNYAINITGTSAQAIYVTSNDVIANSGTLSISKTGSDYSGTFSFSTASGIVATNGTFLARGQ